MTKTIYLHFGLPKTGSSVIQSGLFSARDKLSTLGIRYLHTGINEFYDFGHHILVMGALGQKGIRIDQTKSIDRALEYWDLALAEIEACVEKNIFISSELFSLDIDTLEAFTFLKSKLHNYEVKIVLVLRDVVDFVNSAYSQRVRDGYVGNIDDYIEDLWPSLNWAELVDRWSQLFNKNSMIVLQFEDLSGDCLVNKFFKQTFSIDLDLNFLKNAAMNKRLPHSAIIFKRELNSYSIPDEAKIRLRNHLTSFFSSYEIDERKSDFLSPEAKRMLYLNCKQPEMVSKNHSTGRN